MPFLSFSFGFRYIRAPQILVASQLYRQTIVVGFSFLFSFFVSFPKISSTLLVSCKLHERLARAAFSYPRSHRENWRCTPSTHGAIGWEAKPSWDSFEVRSSKRLLYFQPLWEMPRCPAIYCIWHHDDCQVCLRYFFIYFPPSIYECGIKIFLGIGSIQL